ncbi:fumarylacetoacetate hydrolase family protein [Leifsonia shinshuensis]
MRIANRLGRAVLLRDRLAFDLATVSDGAFGPDPMTPYRDWEAFLAAAPSFALTDGEPFLPEELGPPVPAPSQVFAIGLNYRDHAAEANLDLPADLIVFTKFASSLAGPNAAVALPSEHVDYETELVVVIGRRAHRIAASEGWGAVAGLCVGQDFSDRGVQLRGPAPQFSLGKSFPGFGPFGPAVVTLDEVSDRDSLGVRATLSRSGADPIPLQDGNTRDLIFDVPRIIADLSQVVELAPGDLIFTGTPAGVGATRGLFLREGDVVHSEIDGLGRLENSFTS